MCVSLERHSDRSSMCWFPPQMPTVAGAVPGCGQEPGTRSGPAVWLQGPKCESHRLLPPARTGAGSWDGRRQDSDPAALKRDPVPRWLPQRLLGDAVWLFKRPLWGSWSRGEFWDPAKQALVLTRECWEGPETHP